jgi:hypothetical protein
MALIDVKALEPSELFGEDIPLDTILSRRGACDEVSWKFIQLLGQENRFEGV